MSKTKDQVQQEALAALYPVHRGTVVGGTGTGKTKIGLDYADHYYTDDLRVIVATPTNVIAQSWKDDMVKFNLTHLEQHFTYTTYLSLDKQGLDADILILDEVHSILNSHDEWLSKFKGRIVGLTGSPPLYANSEKAILIAKYCPVVYTYLVDEAIEDGILNDYKILVHELQLNHIKSMVISKPGKGTWTTSEVASYEYWSKRLEEAERAKEIEIARIMRMKALMGFPSKEHYAKKLMNSITEKVLVFANTQKQADSICKHSYHSKNSKAEQNLEDFKTGKITKLSCVLQLNEGANIPELKQAIILHSYGNNTKTTQRLGRELRLDPGDTATIHILMYKDTQDEQWVKQALRKFDQSKITYLKPELV